MTVKTVSLSLGDRAASQKISIEDFLLGSTDGGFKGVGRSWYLSPRRSVVGLLGLPWSWRLALTVQVLV